jgi:hypothetical protein
MRKDNKMPLIVEQVETRIGYNNTYETEVRLRGWDNGFQYNDLFGKDLTEFVSPNKVVIKCHHCGQWGARKCACKSCGAPIE